jgi:polyisoprenoid-binding protein YceI
MNARILASIGLSTLALAAGLLVAGFSSVQAKPAQAKPPASKPPASNSGEAKPAQGKANRAAGGYAIDSVHTTVLFKVKHLNTSWAFGRFNNVTGSFTLLPDNMERSSINVTIDTTSIDTNEPKRDAHLKSDAFFDVEQFPDATFVSHAIKKSGDTKYSAEGSLTLHGVKKPLTIELEEVGTIDSPKMGVLAGFFGQFTIKRSDFGMAFMTEMLGDEVQVTVSIEGRQTDAK